MERKLASIRRIDELNPIENADSIEVCTVGGWKVVAQKGLHKPNDLAVFCEIDSFIPTAIAPFLTQKGHYPKQFNGVEGERLRTIRLRGQVSQGLLMPVSEVLNVNTIDEFGYQIITSKFQVDSADTICGNNVFVEGLDVTKLLNIQKWEAPISAQLSGTVLGNFPSFIQKTDQERIQNLKRELQEWKDREFTWEVSEKLDGSSMTVYVRGAKFGVCSRNLELKEDAGNSFWRVARRDGLEEKIRSTGRNLALQGELIGPGVQGNPYKLKDMEFRVFDIFDIDKFEYLSPSERINAIVEMVVYHVPVMSTNTSLEELSIEDLLKYSENKSSLNENTEREGIVFKCNQCEASFKVISNKFLLKEKA